MYKLLPILLFAYALSVTTDEIYDDSWALIIGIDKYENDSNLDYAVDDADPEDQEYNIRSTLSKAKVDKLNKAVGKADTKIPENLKEKLEEVPKAKSLLEK